MTHGTRSWLWNKLDFIHVNHGCLSVVVVSYYATVKQWNVPSNFNSSNRDVRRSWLKRTCKIICRRISKIPQNNQFYSLLKGIPSYCSLCITYVSKNATSDNQYRSHPLYHQQIFARRISNVLRCLRSEQNFSISALVNYAEINIKSPEDILGHSQMYCDCYYC